MELQLEGLSKTYGTVKAGNVLKVDSFLNHQMDIDLFNEMGKEWAHLFADRKITKILTVEASGIGIACVAAQHFHVPVVFAKKSQSVNIDGEVYSTKIESFTHKRVYDVIDELPMALECKVKSFEDGILVGDIVNVNADESILTDGKIDPKKLKPISYDPVNNTYLAMGDKVGNAFKDGLKLK